MAHIVTVTTLVDAVLAAGLIVSLNERISAAANENAQQFGVLCNDAHLVCLGTSLIHILAVKAPGTMAPVSERHCSQAQSPASAL